MMGTSTLVLQMTDPNRVLLRNLIAQGTTITINGSTGSEEFVLVQFTKASDQIQLTFESQTVYRLRNQRGNGSVVNMVGTNVTPYVTSLVSALNYKGSPYPNVSIVAPDYATIWKKLTNTPITKVALGRGTTNDPYEDSWTAMNRIASSIGWRLWENNNTIYFGPDEWLIGKLNKINGIVQPPVNIAKTEQNVNNIKHLGEFTEHVQLIDFDWDVGKPFGQATITAILDNWTYDIGEIVYLDNMGPATGYWMISAMQRDMFNPQASMTLQVPMPFSSVFEPTSLPVAGFPLKPYQN
jgi:hypothetical protein